VLNLPCDKDRIKPFCQQLWERKSNHFQALSPMQVSLHGMRGGVSEE
jgi:hypothetical protein